MKIGLQVYTVRDAIAKNFEHAFGEVKKAGCKYIELFGLFDKSAVELKSFFDGLNLSVPAIMFSVPKLLDELEAVIEVCKTLGSTYVVCPSLPQEYLTDEGYLRAAGILEQAAIELKKSGINLVYHNHAFEFETLESGKCGYDILVANTTLLKFELDVFWVQYAGLNPLEKMKELDDRLGLVHLKDMDKTHDKNFCELGGGVIDLEGVISIGEQLGVEYAFVEQDRNWINDNPVESVQKSFDWLKNRHG